MKAELAQAKNISGDKATRKAAVEISRSKLSSVKAINKYFKEKKLEEPDYTLLDKCYERQDEIEAEIKSINNSLSSIKKTEGKGALAQAKAKAADLRKELRAESDKAKKLNDEYAYFNRAAKPYIDAKKLLTQSENYQKFDEISSVYEEAKARCEAAAK